MYSYIYFIFLSFLSTAALFFFLPSLQVRLGWLSSLHFFFTFSYLICFYSVTHITKRGLLYAAGELLYIFLVSLGI